MLSGPDRLTNLHMATPKGLRRATLAATGLLLLASCGGQEVTQARFEEACKAQGHAEGSKQMADCVERRWAVYRYQPRRTK